MATPLAKIVPPAPTALPAVLLGCVTAVDPEQGPLVDFPGNPAGPVPARLLVNVEDAVLQRAAETRQPVALMFENSDPSRPLIVGLVQSPGAPQEVRVDGKRVVLTGAEEVELRCGEASISRKKDARAGFFPTVTMDATVRIEPGDAARFQVVLFCAHGSGNLPGGASV